MTSRGFSLLASALLAVTACEGERDAPSPVDRPPIIGPGSSGSGNNDGGGGAASQGGSGAEGGASTGGGGSNEGGAVPVFFADCACALETLNTQNADCDQCVQVAQDTFDDVCYQRYDDCLVDPDCLPMLQELRETCGDDRSIQCAEGALAGMPHDSAETFVAYYECICAACADSCVPTGEGGAGGGGGDGGGGAVPQPFCEIAP